MQEVVNKVKTFVQQKNFKKMNTKDTELHDVSLIIATYNEEESLGYVLNEIKDFNIGEIIIIDKNSQIIQKILLKNTVKFITSHEKAGEGPLKKPLNFIQRIYYVYGW